MPAARNALLIIFFLSLAQCVRQPKIALEPAPLSDSIRSRDVIMSLFLIGDAGSPNDDDAVITELMRQAKKSAEGSVIVFLGDNVYPRGIPADTVPTYAEARRRLLAQASVAESTKKRVIFIPGNHDWDRQRATGWQQVQRQGILLRAYAKEKKVDVGMLPTSGCPGPVVVPLESGIRLVIIDTQWWLHQRVRPGFGDDVPEFLRSDLPEPDYRCIVSSQDIFVDSLKAIFSRDRATATIVLGHHPLESHGEHGGHHPWTHWVFPFIPVPITRGLWLPIGWIYPVGRKIWGDPQDIHGNINAEMRRKIESSFEDDSPLIYAAGHEHSLEVIRRGKRYYLVSGAGMEEHQSPVRYGDSTTYASAFPGFMRVDVLKNGRIRLGVTIIDRDRKPTEAYNAWIGQLKRPEGRNVKKQ